MAVVLLLAALTPLVACMPTAAAPIGPRAASLPPRYSIQKLGYTTSNFPNIYRDGGGGGTINGLNFILFSDGIYTSGGVPASDLHNMLNFSSNSIACSNCDGKGITSLQDFGNSKKGPYQQVPFFYNKGELENITAIWPNSGITTMCNGACGVFFPPVIDRVAYKSAQPSEVYNTAVQIGLTGFGPVMTRPVQKLFLRGEPWYGSFSSFLGIDGYLYLFAKITDTATSNGLKMARVLASSFADRSKYQYWNGKVFTSQMPAYDDGGVANIFSYNQLAWGSNYGPGTGELFYNVYYGCYMLLFQLEDAALDQGGKLRITTLLRRANSRTC
jgi:hypothetical protein